MQSFYNSFLYHADGFLISFYRLTGHPFLDYLVGTVCLALLCVLAGEVTVSLAIRFNQRYIDEMAQEMNQKEKMSMAAYQAGDKPGYKALNKQATDAWGKHFFTMVGYSAGICAVAHTLCAGMDANPLLWGRFRPGLSIVTSFRKNCRLSFHIHPVIHPGKNYF